MWLWSVNKIAFENKDMSRTINLGILNHTRRHGNTIYDANANVFAYFTHGPREKCVGCTCKKTKISKTRGATRLATLKGGK